MYPTSFELLRFFPGSNPTCSKLFGRLKIVGRTHDDSMIAYTDPLVLNFSHNLSVSGLKLHNILLTHIFFYIVVFELSCYVKTVFRSAKTNLENPFKKKSYKKGNGPCVNQLASVHTDLRTPAYLRTPA